MKSRLWQAGLLFLGLGSGCGGSSSQKPDERRPSSGSDAGNDSSAGANASEGNTTAPAGGSNGGAGTNAGGGAEASAGAEGTDVGGSGGAGGSGASAGGANTSVGGAPVGIGGTGPNAGGAANGGTSQGFGGSGGPGAPDLALPPGCQPEMPEETEELCRLAVNCDTAPSVRTYCHRLDSGRWECQCTNHENLYQLENTAGLQACALAAELCSDPELELGEENCEHNSESSDPDGCASEVACSRPVGLDAGAETQAWLVRSGGAYCDTNYDGQTFRCLCQGDGATGNYALLAAGSDLACGPLVDFCMSGATPELVGEEACVLDYLTRDTEGCGRSERCGPRMPLTDDVSLVELEQRYASCAPLESGGSECSCSGQDSGFVFQLPTPPDNASCESSIPNCDPNAVIVATAPANCGSPAVDVVDENMCRTFLSCLVDATVDSRSIVARGNLIVVCRRAEIGMPWVCSFSTGPESDRLELGAESADAAQACADASAAILESPGLYLGPYEDLREPPDPL